MLIIAYTNNFLIVVLLNSNNYDKFLKKLLTGVFKNYIILMHLAAVLLIL